MSTELLSPIGIPRRVAAEGVTGLSDREDSNISDKAGDVAADDL